MPERAPNEPEDERPEAQPSMRDTGAESDEPDQVEGPSEDPDVYLDIPALKVDEISLEVEDLHAHVSLQAEVLDLVKLHVGVDATLGHVALDIKGVEAQAQLKARLDNVAAILDRVLTTIDRNPEILQHVTRGLETATREVAKGTGEAVEEVGRGAGEAVEDVGEGGSQAARAAGRVAGETADDVKSAGARSAPRSAAGKADREQAGRQEERGRRRSSRKMPSTRNRPRKGGGRL